MPPANCRAENCQRAVPNSPRNGFAAQEFVRSNRTGMLRTRRRLTLWTELEAKTSFAQLSKECKNWPLSLLVRRFRISRSSKTIYKLAVLHENQNEEFSHLRSIVGSIADDAVCVTHQSAKQ